MTSQSDLPFNAAPQAPLLDARLGALLREDAIERVDENSDGWVDVAERQVEVLIRSLDTFTTDDLWAGVSCGAEWRRVQA